MSLVSSRSHLSEVSSVSHLSLVSNWSHLSLVLSWSHRHLSHLPLVSSWRHLSLVSSWSHLSLVSSRSPSFDHDSSAGGWLSTAHANLATPPAINTPPRSPPIRGILSPTASELPKPAWKVPRPIATRKLRLKSKEKTSKNYHSVQVKKSRTRRLKT